MRPIFALITSCLVAACGPAAPPQVSCRVGADCASGVCQSDGTCAAPAQDGGPGGGTADGGSGGGAGGGSGGGTGGGTGGGSGGGSGGGTADGGGLTCSPNRDGTITRAELPLAAGLHATFRVASNATFNSAGSAADGGLTWDLTVALSGDKAVLVETQPLAGKWFENKFPGATYATPLSATDSLLGVFEVAPDGLLLRGVVSPTDSFTATELKYDPPAKLLGFPMSVGGTWSTTSTVSGRLNGGLWTQTEKYDSAIDKQGEAQTPFAGFPVLRVKTVLTRTIGFTQTVSRSFLFVTECFGTVATLNSQANESQTEFSSAAEVRRLSP